MKTNLMQWCDEKSPHVDEAVPFVAHPLPDPAVCAGRRIMDSHMVVCTAESECRCKLSLFSSELLMCTHPMRLEIAARTRSLEREKRVSQFC